MWLSRCHRQIGVSQLEIILVIVLVFIFVSTLLSEAHKFYQDSEKMQVEATLERLHGAINSLSIEHMVTGDLSELARYRETNPMLLLASKSLNYRGEITGGEQPLEPASWYYSRTTRQLIYQLRDSSKVKQSNTNGQLRFKVNLKYQDVNNNQRYDAGIDSVSGLFLQPISPFKWVKP